MSGPARLPTVRIERVTVAIPAGRQAIAIRDCDGRVVGQLDYQVCHPCRLGYIDRIAVASRWQGKGLGREAVHTALAPCTGYAWSTSRQSPEGRRFFSAMEEETDVAFPASAVRCPHMVWARHPDGPEPGGWRRGDTNHPPWTDVRFWSQLWSRSAPSAHVHGEPPQAL